MDEMSLLGASMRNRDDHTALTADDRRRACRAACKRGKGTDSAQELFLCGGRALADASR